MQPLIHLNALLIAGLLALAPCITRTSPTDQRSATRQDPLIGDWIGTSICQLKNSPCHDENVVFHFSPANVADHYRVKADKIVNGQPDFMGELDFLFDKATQTLTCAIPSGTWVLKRKQSHIDGTLTTPDNILFRKLTLSKVQ
ncbi:MAG: hypothetical protein Q8927_20940 [Bacteroidota bacterium]|nr:hypothetical protein [Bacteroidota bacterium]MDP4248385.1 hypothetical protein [Bacteroidota bacterium]MDP4254242.1 hypothetical protein [Bacteroidota bacterium]MDP4260067.1 hypothetical protein [Bacteroidota bacterium]